MRRYADRPMDFADATLVHVAERESIATVFTVDFDDFETYRFFRATPLPDLPRPIIGARRRSQQSVRSSSLDKLLEVTRPGVSARRTGRESRRPASRTPA